MPFPFDSWSGGRISGMTPYLAGTKNAECVPIRNTAASTSHGADAGSPCRPEPEPDQGDGR